MHYWPQALYLTPEDKLSLINVKQMVIFQVLLRQVVLFLHYMARGAFKIQLVIRKFLEPVCVVNLWVNKLIF